MSLADDLLAPVSTHGASPCGVVLLLATLDEADADVVRGILAQPFTTYPSTVLAKRLTDGGYKIAASSLQRHRRGGCECPR